MDRTNAERQARWRARLKARDAGGVSNDAGAGEVAALRDEVAALKQELAAAKEHIKEMALELILQAQAIRDENQRRPTKPHYDDAIAKAGGMPRETRLAIDKILHPDGDKSEAARDEACKAWNAWKNSNDKARRR